jgi:predicted phage terminase large subunit-like protein
MLCQHLQALSTNTLTERNLLINEPPGSSKSLITVVFWPAWEWTWAPWTRWLTSSYTEDLALRDAVRTRRLMMSGWYQAQVIEPWKFSSDQNVKGYYSNDRTGWRIARGVNGAVTSHHAHRVVVDDPHNVHQAESDAVRNTTLTTLREVYPSRVLPGGARVIVGQRVHEEDATADWLDRERSSIHHIEIQEEYEAPTQSQSPAPFPGIDKVTASARCSLTGHLHDIRHTDGELLSPGRRPRQVIELRKIELGPYAYSSQYQQRPTPRAGMVLNPDWFIQTPRLEAATVDLIMAFDLNYSDDANADWTVGMCGAVERSPVLPRIHIIDLMRDHLGEQRHEQVIGDWILLWRPIMVGIEKRAFEKEGATMDLCRRLLIYLDEHGFTCNIEPVPADTDKVTRAQIIPGRAKAGLVTVDRHARWWPTLSREMSTFPKSQHDDQIDTMAHLIRLAVEKLGKVRDQKILLGHSAALEYAEDGGEIKDWQRAALAGIR